MPPSGSGAIQDYSFVRDNSFFAPFLVSAVKVDRAYEPPLEFPLKFVNVDKTSFISMPLDWSRYFNKDPVEFVAMSLDPENVNLILPGQFE